MKKFILTLLLISASAIIYTQTTEVETHEYIGILSLTTYYQTDSNWTDADIMIVGAHFQRLQQFAAEGKVILAGRTELASNDPDMIGIVIIAATTKSQAEQIMFEDPAVVNKIMSAELFPFNVAVQSNKQ